MNETIYNILGYIVMIFVMMILIFLITDYFRNTELDMKLDITQDYLDKCYEARIESEETCQIELVEAKETGLKNCKQLIELQKQVMKENRDEVIDNCNDLHSAWQNAFVTLENCYVNSLPKCNFLIPQVDAYFPKK